MGKNRSVLWSALVLALSVAEFGAAPARADTAAVDSAVGTDPRIEGLQEVVVTATKRNEDLQSVGLSITAISAQQLESKGVENFFDYGTAIPNLSFGIGAADGSLAARGIALRGIQGANTTGFYVDDTPVLETLDPHIVDVERIEVLRGPQGTLYGAESMGGTVRIITAQPSATAFSGQVHLIGSDTKHGSWNDLVEGDINVPLVSDLLSVRASGFYQFDSGFFDKGLGPESAPPTAVITGVGSMTYYGGQIALRYEPLEGLAITPRLMFQETDQDGVPYAKYDPGNLLQREVFNIREGGTDKWWLGSLTLDYTAPFGSFVSSSAVFDRRTFETEDDTDILALILSLPSPIPAPITRSIGLHRFAQEVRFASSFSGPFQLIAGGFYSTGTRPRNYEWTSTGLMAATGSPSSLVSAFIDQRQASEYALFGDASYDILRNLKATVGVRWFRNTATFNQYTNGLLFGGASTYNVQPTSETGVTPKYLLEYKAAQDLLLYTSAAKGFREGGDNVAVPLGPPPVGCSQDLANIGLTAAQVATFRSDSLWNYEAGVKASFDDHRFTVSADGFLIQWDNIQQQVSLPMCGFGITGNSGRAKSTGAEFEFSARPRPELTFGLGFGYEDARITKQGVGSPQLVGSPVYQVPGVTIASNIEYERHLSAYWSGFARVDFSHIGGSVSANNSQVNPLYRPAYSITDMRVGLRRERYEVTAFVKNLFNKQADLGDAILIGAEIAGQPRFAVNQPRTAGIAFRMRFK